MSGIGGVQTADGSTPPPILLSALGRALLHRGPDGETQFTSGGNGLLHLGLKAAPGLDLAFCQPAEDRIVLGRDAFGLRPLYYAETERGLVFASEPRAILASGLTPPKICPGAVTELVQIQFTTSRQTLFEGIFRVLPGETVIAERGKVVERRRATSLPNGIDSELSETGAITRLEALLAAALQTDLPVSGGAGLIFDGRIESCALAAALKTIGRGGVPFFTVTDGGPVSVELALLAARTAKACGGEAVLIDLEAEDFFAALPRVVASIDDPGSDYSAVALHALAAKASADARLLLSDAGGDVLFGGLGRYRSALRPLWLGGRAMRARGFLEGLGILREENSFWRDGVRASESRLASRGGLTRLQVVQALDCAHWLPNDVLPVLDRCLQTHAIEPRAPYLDPALAQFAFTLPDHLKVAPGRGSVLLRRWLARILPETEPFARHRGHSLPVTAWIARDALNLGPLVAANEGIRDLCLPGSVRRLFDRLSLRPHKRLGQAAWQLLFYALWHRIHIEGNLAEGSVHDVLS